MPIINKINAIYAGFRFVPHYDRRRSTPARSYAELTANVNLFIPKDGLLAA
jgi:hypothetical protein